MPDVTPISQPEPGKERPDYRDRQDWRERRHRDRRSGLFWGLALILLGILLFGATRGWLSWDNWWHYFLIGLGIIFLLGALVNYMSSDRVDSIGRIIPGVILICVGIAFIYGWDMWWPLVLIAAGVAVLLTLVFKRRSS
jgi:hypothetical protein